MRRVGATCGMCAKRLNNLKKKRENWNEVNQKYKKKLVPRWTKFRNKISIGECNAFKMWMDLDWSPRSWDQKLKQNVYEFTKNNFYVGRIDQQLSHQCNGQKKKEIVDIVQKHASLFPVNLTSNLLNNSNTLVLVKKSEY